VLLSTSRVAACARVLPVSQRPEVSAYNLEFMDLIFSHFETKSRRTQATSTSSEVGVYDASGWNSTKEGREWHDSWCRFAALLPSPWYGELLLYASPEDASERVDQLAKAIKHVLLRSAPCLPCQGKWLPTG
jgi:hypothetical protein